MQLNIFSIAEITTRIKATGAVTISNFLDGTTLKLLLGELSHLNLVEQPTTIGKYNVQQNFRSVSDFSPDGMFCAIQTHLASILNELFSKLSPSPLSEPLKFTDAVVQTYDPSEMGISPHRDGPSSINLIAVLILEGRGDFFLCNDRQGNGSLPVKNDPGDMILMRGPGFLGADIEPYHYVGKIHTRRTSFALRHRIKK